MTLISCSRTNILLFYHLAITWLLRAWLMWIISLSRYMVDAADHEKVEASRNEFHNLLDKPQLAGIPVLVLANKRDVAGAMDEREVIDKM